MVTAIIFISMLLFLVLAGFLAKRGWIELPRDPNAIQLIALGGGGVLLFLGFCVFVIGNDISDQGLLPVLSCWGPLILLGLVGLLAGWAYFTRRRMKKGSDVQKLDLDK